jgi:preprotein translocase subunit SecG
MFGVVLVLHLIIVCVLVGVVLLQRSEGGALGSLGGGGGLGGLMTGRGAASALTRTTAILAVAFFVTSILLAVMSGAAQKSPSVLDTAPEQGGAAQIPVAPLPEGTGSAPPTPANPSAPLPQ